MKESRTTRSNPYGHDTYMWVVSPIWWHTWSGHVTHMKESRTTRNNRYGHDTHVHESCHPFDDTHDQVMSHIWIHESCLIHLWIRHTYEYIYTWVMSRVCMNESWHMTEVWVMSHISNGGRRVWHVCSWEMDESCLIYVWVSHVSYMYGWVMSHISSREKKVWHVCRWVMDESCLMNKWMSHVSWINEWVMSHE